MLGYGFDHEVDIAARVFEVLARRQLAERELVVGLRELAELDALREVLADLADRGFRGALQRVLDAHVAAGERAHVRDAVAHRARADHGHRVNSIRGWKRHARTILRYGARVHALDADRLQRELEAIFGPRRVSTRAVDLETYSRDMWPRMLIEHRDGVPAPHRPYAIVWPEHVREVVAVVKLAREHAIPIVPYGGGSGVCGGAVPIRGGITIDTKRMQQLRAVHADELICDVEAGLNGERFERELERRGYTFGHFPSSIYCSTVGGWLATRAAGQLSTKYGKVEDRVAGLTVVTGRGEMIETDGPSRALRGPSWTQLVCGSEGTLGIITSARLRVSPAPQLRVFRGFEVDDIAAGANAIRRVVQRGLRPAVVRLYDELDTLINSFSHHDATETTELAPPVPELATGALPAWPQPQPEPGFVEKLVGLAK